MSQYIFVPLTDELLYEHPELVTGPIVPYNPQWPCHHWLKVEINPTDDKWDTVCASVEAAA